MFIAISYYMCQGFPRVCSDAARSCSIAGKVALLSLWSCSIAGKVALLSLLNYFHIWNIRIFQVPSERATSDKNLLDKLAAIADEIEELGNDYHTARKLGEVHQRSASTRIQEAVSGSAQDTVQISLK